MNESISQNLSRFIEREWQTTAPQETFQLGEDIGAQLVGGEILLLNGTLGAGKTLFVKGIAAAIECDVDEVTSPTFSLVNIYRGRLIIYHLDLYRLNESIAAAAVDLEELLADETSIILIEWAERIAGYPLPSTAWQINFMLLDENTRRITIESLNQI